MIYNLNILDIEISIVEYFTKFAFEVNISCFFDLFTIHLYST